MIFLSESLLLVVVSTGLAFLCSWLFVRLCKEEKEQKTSPEPQEQRLSIISRAVELFTGALFGGYVAVVLDSYFRIESYNQPGATIYLLAIFEMFFLIILAILWVVDQVPRLLQRFRRKAT